MFILEEKENNLTKFRNLKIMDSFKGENFIYIKITPITINKNHTYNSFCINTNSFVNFQEDDFVQPVDLILKVKE